MASLKYNQRVKFLFPEGTSGGHIKIACVRYKSCLSRNLKTNKANLMELHRKIKHNEMVCQAEELGSHAQGQGRSRGLGKMMP